MEEQDWDKDELNSDHIHRSEGKRSDVDEIMKAPCRIARQVLHKVHEMSSLSSSSGRAARCHDELIDKKGYLGQSFIICSLPTRENMPEELKPRL